MAAQEAKHSAIDLFGLGLKPARFSSPFSKNLKFGCASIGHPNFEFCQRKTNCKRMSFCLVPMAVWPELGPERFSLKDFNPLNCSPLDDPLGSQSHQRLSN